MKLSPKRALIAAAITTAVMGVSVTAIAQGMQPELHAQHMAQRGDKAPDAEQYAQRHAERMAQMEKRRAEHQARLKADLKLSAEQEPAWNAFVARMQPDPGQQMAGKRTAGDREAWAKLTTPERLDKMQALKAERDAKMAQRTEAVKSFYAALTPEQQKTFDSQHMGMRHAGMRGEHRMGREGGGKGRMEHRGPQGMGCEGGMPQRS